MHRYIFIIFSLCALALGAQIPSDTVVMTDSARIAHLTARLETAMLNEAALRLEVEQLSMSSMADSLRQQHLRHRIDSLKLVTPAAMVVVDGDTLFAIYAKQGGLDPKERALHIASEITRIGHQLALEPDSVYVVPDEYEADVMYGDDIIMSVTELDGLWADSERDTLAHQMRDIIVAELHQLKARYGFWQLIKRLLSLVAIVLGVIIVFKLVNKAYRHMMQKIDSLKDTKLKPFYIQSVELLDTKRQLALLQWLARALRVGVLAMVVIVAVTLLFSVFPQTRSLAHSIFYYIYNPVRDILVDIIDYIPNLFTIIVICVVIHYLVKLLRYLANEVAKERLRINGFFSDWALPTFYIIRFLLYAFMIAMIYPYLPGSNSGVFQGVSVFVGLIVSLGSSSVIGNLMAGLVITYMRPFRMGDRIEVKDITGNVIEKTPFVTRIRTLKNEVVTMPNSFIMSAHVVNYTQSAQQFGLIIHTDVTMGYEISWRKITDTLIEAALATPGIQPDPRPFVLQTSLGDDYTVYQLNAYIRDAQLLPDIYTALHEKIQDYFTREGMELVSPRYVSARDGNRSTLCDDPYGKK